MENNELKILCPFCNAPYTARMVREFDTISEGACSCGSWSHHEDTVEIICSNCNKIVYSKVVSCGDNNHLD